MTADPLSDLLRSVRLIGGVFLRARFTAPWCVTARVSPEDCTPFFEAPGQVIAYHFVLSGSLLLGVDGEPPVRVRAGEIVLLPRNDLHLLGSSLAASPVDAGTLIVPGADGQMSRIDWGGGGEETVVICGFLGTAESYNPVIASLPCTLVIDVGEGASRAWIDASVRFAADEMAAGRMTSSAMMARLSELLLVEAVRQYSVSRPPEETGWFMGLRDPQVGRALALIHRDMRTHWSAEALAREVALSRSAFMARFSALVGVPPIKYLTTWRLQNAKEELRAGRRSVAETAYSVGYESEEAFSRAFKREFGQSPAHWRQALVSA